MDSWYQCTHNTGLICSMHCLSTTRSKIPIWDGQLFKYIAVMHAYRILITTSGRPMIYKTNVSNDIVVCVLTDSITIVLWLCVVPIFANSERIERCCDCERRYDLSFRLSFLRGYLSIQYHGVICGANKSPKSPLDQTISFRNIRIEGNRCYYKCGSCI